MNGPHELDSGDKALDPANQAFDRAQAVELDPHPLEGNETALAYRMGEHRPAHWKPGMEDEVVLTVWENPGATMLIREAKESQRE